MDQVAGTAAAAKGFSVIVVEIHSREESDKK
jgi:hypothetical protein